MDNCFFHTIKYYQILVFEILLFHGIKFSPEAFCNMGYPSETGLQLKYREDALPKTYYSVIQSFSNFAQSTAVSLPWSVNNHRMIGLLNVRYAHFARFEYKMDILSCAAPHCYKQITVNITAKCWIYRLTYKPHGMIHMVDTPTYRITQRNMNLL